MPVNEDNALDADADERVVVHPAQFSSLADEAEGSGLSLDLVFDISMPVTVELGRTTMTVKELLQLRTGSVVELDQMAGEPISLYVRDVCFARGEVVVVDNNFGLRVTEIINPKRQLGALGHGEDGVDKTDGR
jgi:flagellar motor switch protein FliN/FliY